MANVRKAIAVSAVFSNFRPLPPPVGSRIEPSLRLTIPKIGNFLRVRQRRSPKFGNIGLNPLHPETSESEKSARTAGLLNGCADLKRETRLAGWGGRIRTGVFPILLTV